MQHCYSAVPHLLMLINHMFIENSFVPTLYTVYSDKGVKLQPSSERLETKLPSFGMIRFIKLLTIMKSLTLAIEAHR